MLGRGPGRWGPGDALRIRLLLAAAFTALFGSLIVVTASWAGFSPIRSVQGGAAALLIGYAHWFGRLANQVSRLAPDQRALFDQRLANLIRVVGAIAALSQVVVVVGLAGDAGRALFLFGVLACLGYAVLGFMRLMFIRPESD